MARMGKTCLSILAFSIFACVAAPGAALAQHDAAAGPNWAVRCDPVPDSAASACMMWQNLSLRQENGAQRLLTVMIQPDGAQGWTMVLALPHGVLLPAGARYAIDGGEPVALTILTSDAAGAYAPTPFTETLANALSAGAQMQVTFQAANGQAMTVPVTLSGFAEAHAALRAGVPTQ